MLRPLHGTLLLAATLLRPLPANLRHQREIMWDERPMQVLPGVDTYGSARLKTFADLGANRLMVSDHWAIGYGRPEPFHPPNFRHPPPSFPRRWVNCNPCMVLAQTPGAAQLTLDAVTARWWCRRPRTR